MELELHEKHGLGDFVRATGYEKSLSIETWCEWDGDTENGFGRGATVTLTVEQATELRDFLSAFIESTTRI